MLVIIKYMIKYDPCHACNIPQKYPKMLVRTLCKHKYSKLSVEKITFNKPLL